MKLRNVDALRLFALCGALGGFGLMWGLLVGRANFARAGDKAAPAIVGLPDDWTHHHVVFTNSGPPQVMERARQDPRYWLQQLKRQGAENADVFNLRRGAPLIPRGVLPLPPLPPPSIRRARKTTSVDWSVSLGAAGAAVVDGMYPAKFTFDVNGTADCTNDFMVFALDVGGSSTQASILAFNNLYSVYPAGGLCGFAPTVKWAYNTTTAGKVLAGINTSPVLSLDGTKVAFVENAAPPVFHVLTIGTTGSNGTSPTTPVVPCTIITNGSSSTSCATNNAVDARLTLGASSGDTQSAAFVDYTNDVAYAGANDGNLYKITGVFKGSPALAGAPFPLAVSLTSSGKILTSPVLDSVNPARQRAFIGTGDGILKMVRLAASDPCTGAVPAPCVDSTTVQVSQGGSHAIIDGPIVDSTNQTIFVSLNDNGASQAVVVQATTSLGSPVVATVGHNTGQPAHSGYFDNAYFTSPGTGHLYVCGTGTSGATPSLWDIGFTGSTMNSSAANGPLALSTTTNFCSPATEFFNPNLGGGKDFLFVSVATGCSATVTGGCIRAFDITGGFPTATTGVGVVTVAEAGGTSGIVVDNVSTSSQASSIYFTNLADTSKTVGSNAIKLTQSGLN